MNACCASSSVNRSSSAQCGTGSPVSALRMRVGLVAVSVGAGSSVWNVTFPMSTPSPKYAIIGAFIEKPSTGLSRRKSMVPPPMTFTSFASSENTTSLPLGISGFSVRK